MPSRNPTITSVLLEAVLGKPATRLYPAQKRPPFPGSRGRLVFTTGRCNHCTLCAKKCPTDAIAVDRADKTWEVDYTRCIVCGNCVTACKQSALSLAPDYAGPVSADRKAAFRERHREQAAAG